MEKQLFETIVDILEEKKAVDIKVIDIKEMSIFADYFIICTGNSTTHIKSLSDEIQKRLKEYGVKIKRVEGYSTARWILLDIGDVIVHIFHNEERDFYNIEKIWSEGGTSK